MGIQLSGTSRLNRLLQVCLEARHVGLEHKGRASL